MGTPRNRYYCCVHTCACSVHMLLFLYTHSHTRTQCDYIILIFTVSSEHKTQCDKHRMPKTNLLLSHFCGIRVENRLCQYALIQPNTKCVGLHYGCTIRWCRWLSHSVRMIRMAAKWYGRLVSLTVLRNTEIFECKHTAEECGRERERQSVSRRWGEIERKRWKRENASELWMFRLHINSIEHTNTPTHICSPPQMYRRARERAVCTMCILKMAAWHVYKITAAVAANGSTLSM